MMRIVTTPYRRGWKIRFEERLLMTPPAAQKTKSSCVGREHLLQLDHRATQEKHYLDSQLKPPWEKVARETHTGSSFIRQISTPAPAPGTSVIVIVLPLGT